MSPCSARNALISARSRVISVGGIRSGNSMTKIFSGALRTCAGSLTTSVLGWTRSSNARGGDIGEVEGRVLPQQDDVERWRSSSPVLARPG